MFGTQTIQSLHFHNVQSKTILAILKCVCLCVSSQELDCLQEHLEDLVSACRDVMGNLTELESEVSNVIASVVVDGDHKLNHYIVTFSYFFYLSQDVQIDALLIRACEPMIQSHCHVRTFLPPSEHTHKHSF